jgi:hypothetical protein
MLLSPRYSRSASVRIQHELDSIANKNFNPVQAHFSSQICEHYLVGSKLDAEQCIRKRLFDDSFYDCFITHSCAR